MGHRGRKRPMTDKEISDVAAAVDELGEWTVNALVAVAETDRDAEGFDVDPDDYEFPGSDS
jgi:hypothetical protein